MRNLGFLARLNQNLARFSSLSGKTIVSDGQRVGPGVGQSANVVKGTTVSQNAKEAKTQEEYEKSVLGQGVDANISEEELGEVVDKYLENVVNDLLKDV